MNIGAIQKAANVTNSTPKNDTIGCTKGLAAVYNDLQRGKEEMANQKKIDEVVEPVISAKDLINEENQDKNRGIIEDKEIGE